MLSRVPKIDLSSLNSSSDRSRSAGLQSKSCEMPGGITASSQSRRRSGTCKPPLPDFSSATKTGTHYAAKKPNNAAKERPWSAPTLSRSLEIRKQDSDNAESALNRTDSNLFGSNTHLGLQGLPSPEFAAYLDHSSTFSGSNVTDVASQLNLTTPPPGGPIPNVREDLSLSNDYKQQKKQDAHARRLSKSTPSELAEARRKPKKAIPPSPSRRPDKSILKGSPGLGKALRSENLTGLKARADFKAQLPPQPEDPSPSTGGDSSAVGAPAQVVSGVPPSRATGKAKTTTSHARDINLKSPSPPNVSSKAPLSIERGVPSSSSRQFRNPELARAAASKRGVPPSSSRQTRNSELSRPAVANGVRASSRTAPVDSKKPVPRPASASSGLPSTVVTVARTRTSEGKGPPSPTESSTSSVGSKTSSKSIRSSNAPNKNRGSASVSSAPAYARPTATSSRRARGGQTEESLASKSCSSIPSKSSAGTGSKSLSSGNRRPTSARVTEKKEVARPRSSTADSGRSATSFPGTSTEAAAAVKPTGVKTRAGVSQRTDRTPDKPGPSPQTKARDPSRRSQVKGKADAKIGPVVSGKLPEDAGKGKLSKEKPNPSPQAGASVKLGLGRDDQNNVEPGSLGEESPNLGFAAVTGSTSIRSESEIEVAPKGVTFREEDDVLEFTISPRPGQNGPSTFQKLNMKETAGLTNAEAAEFYRDKRADSGRPVPTIVDGIPPASEEIDTKDGADALLRSLRESGRLVLAEKDLGESLTESAITESEGSGSLPLSHITEEGASQSNWGLGTTMGRGGVAANIAPHDRMEGEESWNEGSSDQESSREFSASFGSGSLGASGMLAASGSCLSPGCDSQAEMQETGTFPLSEEGEEESTNEIEENTDDGAQATGKEEEEKPEKVWVVYPHRLPGYREKYLGHREELEQKEREHNARVN